MSPLNRFPGSTPALERALAALPAALGQSSTCTRIRLLARRPGGPGRVVRFAERAQAALLSCPLPAFPIDQIQWASVLDDARVALGRAQVAQGAEDWQGAFEAGGDAILALTMGLQLEALNSTPRRHPGSDLDGLCARLLEAS